MIVIEKYNIYLDGLWTLRNILLITCVIAKVL